MRGQKKSQKGTRIKRTKVDSKFEEMEKKLRKSIKRKKNNLIKKIDSQSDFDFSVFISHSDEDYPTLHKLCLKMIQSNIKPIIWFKEIKDETVKAKLCKMIDESDLFLIYLSPNSVKSQLTNNEIGFIEGKKYYLRKTKNLDKQMVYRIFHKNITDNELRGFYTTAYDGNKVDPESNADMNSIIRNLVQMYYEDVDIKPRVSKNLIDQKRINYYNMNKWQDKNNIGSIEVLDAKPCIRVNFKKGTNSSIYLHMGEFQKGDKIKVKIKCKAEPQNQSMLFFGDAGGDNPYDNSDFITIPGNGDWQDLEVNVKYAHKDIGMVFLYGSRNKGKKGDYVLYKDLEILKS